MMIIFDAWLLIVRLLVKQVGPVSRWQMTPPMYDTRRGYALQLIHLDELICDPGYTVQAKWPFTII
jgi:hypothetical protein